MSTIVTFLDTDIWLLLSVLCKYIKKKLFHKGLFLCQKHKKSDLQNLDFIDEKKLYIKKLPYPKINQDLKVINIMNYLQSSTG